MKKLKGVSVSPGIVTGKAFLYLENELPEIPRHKLREDQVEGELERLKTTFEEAAAEIQALCEQAKREESKEAEDIFTAHLMMIEDVDFQDQIFARLKESRENGEWVLYDTCQQMIEKMQSSPDAAFRERAVDISDISRRLLGRMLFVKRACLADLDRDIILVAHDLLPSEVLTMNRAYVKGLAMDLGGSTSHTAILARAFNIPALLGISSATEEVRDGDTLILDAIAGTLVINPDKEEMDSREGLAADYHKKLDEYSQIRNLPAETKDGWRVLLKANIGIPEETEAVLQSGAEGIGLYRSEFLFLNRGEAAGEEEQFRAYSQVVTAMGKLPVTIRTVDIGSDKLLADFHAEPEKNPALGWRAIRFCLSKPEFFKTQLRAILRSSVNGNVRIMFPLISGIEELQAALALLDEARNECRKKNQPFADNIAAGIMIEVPSAAVIADILADRCGFFSIGTNDLIQYSLGVDRGNEKVNYLAQPLHPAILRFIKTVIDAAHSHGIKAAMCGEMAGDPGMTALLLGLGLDEFSMTCSSIPPVKQVIRTVSAGECRALAGELLKGSSSAANNEILKNWMAGICPAGCR